jgi:hypothetical protein
METYRIFSIFLRRRPLFGAASAVLLAARHKEGRFLPFHGMNLRKWWNFCEIFFKKNQK